MNKRNIRLTSLLVGGALLFSGTGTNTYASVDNTNTLSKDDNDTLFAGASLSVLDYLNSDVDVVSTETVEQEVVKEQEEILAVAQVENSVYVRKSASTDSDIVGRLYNNNVATVIEELDGWYKIKSGNVKGYVSAEFVSVDEKLVKKAGTRIAKVKADTLRVRKDSNESAGIVTLVGEGDQLKVKSTKVDGWVQVKTSDGVGFVSSEYVEVYTKYTYGETKKEEEARLAREAEEAAAEANANANAGSGNSSSSSSKSNASKRHYKAPSGKSGQAVANYACQFVGNPYRWGGSSLTNGADCSGFVMAVYAKFGVSLPHSSSAMRGVGYGVSKNSMQPGDIVCFRGHVGIYVGGGTMVDANSSRTGIKYTKVKLGHVVCARRIF